MKRLIVNLAMLAVLLIALQAVVVTACWTAHRSANGAGCFTEDPNDSNEPAPQPEGLFLCSADEDPNEPNEPAPQPEIL